jgi:hypothetical protein
LAYPSISLQLHDKDAEEDLIKKIASVVPILNGKDSAGQVIHRGPRMFLITRYLLVLLVAKSKRMFSLEKGKEIENSVYFTLHGLGKIAESFEEIRP